MPAMPRAKANAKAKGKRVLFPLETFKCHALHPGLRESAHGASQSSSIGNTSATFDVPSLQLPGLCL